MPCKHNGVTFARGDLSCRLFGNTKDHQMSGAGFYVTILNIAAGVLSLYTEWPVCLALPAALLFSAVVRSHHLLLTHSRFIDFRFPRFWFSRGTVHHQP